MSNTEIIYSNIADHLKLTDWKGNVIENSNGKESFKVLNLVIFGASGGTGLQVIKEGLKRGHKIIAPVRNPSSLKDFKDLIDIREVDILSVDSIEQAIKGGDVIISQLGSGSLCKAIAPTEIYSTSARNILEAMKKQNIKRVLLTTSVGCDYDENFPWIYRIFIRRLIMNTYMDMARLEAIVEESYKNMDWTILRPCGLVDKEESKTFFVRDKLLKHGKFQISRKDFAKFAIHEAENGLWINGHPAVGYP